MQSQGSSNRLEDESYINPHHTFLMPEGKLRQATTHLQNRRESFSLPDALHRRGTIVPIVLSRQLAGADGLYAARCARRALGWRGNYHQASLSRPPGVVCAAAASLTEWFTPHMRTLSSGSLARKSLTFWATKCFFLVLVLLAITDTILPGAAMGAAEEQPRRKRRKRTARVSAPEPLTGRGGKGREGGKGGASKTRQPCWLAGSRAARQELARLRQERSGGLVPGTASATAAAAAPAGRYQEHPSPDARAARWKGLRSLLPSQAPPSSLWRPLPLPAFSVSERPASLPQEDASLSARSCKARASRHARLLHESMRSGSGRARQEK